jgi:hypothetical protein
MQNLVFSVFSVTYETKLLQDLDAMYGYAALMMRNSESTWFKKNVSKILIYRLIKMSAQERAESTGVEKHLTVHLQRKSFQHSKTTNNGDIKWG